MTTTLCDVRDDFSGRHKILDGPSEEQIYLSMRLFPKGQRLNIFFGIKWEQGEYEKNIPARFLGILHRSESESAKFGLIFFEAEILEPNKKAGTRMVGVYDPRGPRVGAFDLIE